MSLYSGGRSSWSAMKAAGPACQHANSLILRDSHAMWWRGVACTTKAKRVWGRGQPRIDERGRGDLPVPGTTSIFLHSKIPNGMVGNLDWGRK